MTDIESRLPYPEVVNAVAQEMPALIGSIATFPDKLEVLRAMQAAGKVAEGLLGLLDIQPQGRNDRSEAEASRLSSEVTLLMSHGVPLEEAKTFTPIEENEEQDVHYVVPELLEDAQDVAPTSTNSSAEEATQEGDCYLKEVEIESILDDFRGQIKIIAEWFLRNPGQPRAPRELHAILTSPNKAAKKQAFGHAIRRIGSHPRMGQWLRESGTRSSLRYWIELPSTSGDTEVSNSDRSLSETPRLADDLPIHSAEHAVAVTAAQIALQHIDSKPATVLSVKKAVRHTMVPVSRSVENTMGRFGGEPSVPGAKKAVARTMPQPKKNTAKTEKVIEALDQEFVSGATEVRRLGASGLRILEKNGIERLFLNDVSLPLSSLELAIIDVVAENDGGLLFGELRDLVNGRCENPQAIKTLLDSLEKIKTEFANRKVHAWSDSLIVGDDNERWRRIKLESSSQPEQVA